METITRTEPKNLYNNRLREALTAIHKVYGSDLDAFFRDASERNRNETKSPKKPTRRAKPAAKQS